jgi:hypothetical protein
MPSAGDKIIHYLSPAILAPHHVEVSIVNVFRVCCCKRFDDVIEAAKKQGTLNQQAAMDGM